MPDDEPTTHRLRWRRRYYRHPARRWITLHIENPTRHYLSTLGGATLCRLIGHHPTSVATFDTRANEITRRWVECRRCWLDLTATTED